MSNATDQKTEETTSRVKVSNLPEQEKELKQAEAANIKGGGGLSGGVVERGNATVKHIGEEIPQ